MAGTLLRSTGLGRIGAELAEQLAYLNSPAAIAGEIARLEQARREGDGSEATRVLLADWRAVQRAQRHLVGGKAETMPLPTGDA